MASVSPFNESVSDEIVAYYGQSYDEGSRLTNGVGQLECARTQDLLLRHLPFQPAVILDVGGGTGAYALWLARRGYEVHLIDLTPRHVESVRLASELQPEHRLASCEIGDARLLPWPNDGADAVLLLGPLYHLTERADRLAALSEARRVLRPGGLLFAAGISRFASLLDYLSRAPDDPLLAEMVAGDLQDGHRSNATGCSKYFTAAYFHRPDELTIEVGDAGLQPVRTVGIEGPAWLFGNFSALWENGDRRMRLLGLLRQIEHEPSIVGASAHIMVVARREE